VLGASDAKVSKKKNALQYIIHQLKNNEPIDLYNNGEFYRDYMHVEDVVDAIDLVISKSKCDQIYNVGSGEIVKFSKIVEYAKSKLNSKSEIRPITPTEFHKKVQTKDMVLDVQKLKGLGFVPSYGNIKKIIDKLLE
jgi:nucleoside-diphosphate-sugar epimerase